jgi:sugar lactone lactonase YvrE
VSIFLTELVFLRSSRDLCRVTCSKARTVIGPTTEKHFMSKNLAQVAGRVLPILVLMWLAGCGAGGSNDAPGGGATTTPTTPGAGGTNYTVGGTVSGLLGTVVLQNNNGNDLTLSANSGFTFTTPAVTGSGYSVTVRTQPAGQTCAVANGAGTVSEANVTGVTVTCSSPFPSLALFAGDMERNGSVDGIGAAARFSGPEGVATDSAGNVYVADNDNNTIRKITPEGVVTTHAGSGAVGSTDATGTAASFFLPTGVATDSAGNVYVADFYTSIIRKITPERVVTTLVDATGAVARFALPTGVATDSAGNVYVADWDANAIRKITPAGVIITLAGGSAYYSYPHDIATDSAGNVYVSDGHTICKITPEGVLTTLAGTIGVHGSTDATGPAASFNFPSGIATDSAGNVYVADTGNHTIRKITPTGAVSTVVGAAGQAGFAPGALPGLLNGPIGVAVNGTSLYITLLNGVAVVKNLP